MWSNGATPVSVSSGNLMHSMITIVNSIAHLKVVKTVDLKYSQRTQKW